MPKISWAACSWVGNTGTVASPYAYTDVNDCGTDAKSKTGEVIIVIPANTVTWTSKASIDMHTWISPTKLTVKGEGKGVTNISGGGFYFYTKSTIPLVFSGMTLIDAGISIKGCPNNIRVFNIDFERPTVWGVAISINSDYGTCHPNGVAYNNTFHNSRVVVIGSAAMLAEGNQQHQLWADPPGLGDTNAFYIEGNEYTADRFGNAVDQNYGGRYVFRYNTITNSGVGTNSGFYIESHSVQGLNRAAQRWEIYNNILNNTGGSIYYPFRLRGGTGVVFNNSILGTWTSYGIGLDNVRSCSAAVGSGLCDGSVAGWDGNETGGAGYPCRDQIGIGYDNVQWEDTPPGAWAQVKMPVYEWNNKKLDGTTEVPYHSIQCAASQNHIKENRDFYNYNAVFDGTAGVGRGTLAYRPATCTTNVAYWSTDEKRLYKCTATDTWTLY